MIADIVAILLAVFLDGLLFLHMCLADRGITKPLGRFLRRSLGIERDYAVVSSFVASVSSIALLVVMVAVLVTLILTKYFATTGMPGLYSILCGMIVWFFASLLFYAFTEMTPGSAPKQIGFLEGRMRQHVHTEEAARDPLYQLVDSSLATGKALIDGPSNAGKNIEKRVKNVRFVAQTDRYMRKVGVIVVHGIGDQEPGETVEKIQAALAEWLPDKESLRVSWGRIENEDRYLLVSKIQRELRFYEVYWTDCLRPESYGSFNSAALRELAWFPLINSTPGRSRAMAAGHSALLLLAAGFLSIANSAADLCRTLNLLRLFRSYRTEDTANDFNPKDEVGSLQGYLPKRPWVDRLLDDFGGDVVSYVVAASYFRARGGRVHGTQAALKIYNRFAEKLIVALQECDEVHVLAHSLGTVIAYDVLTQIRPRAKITDLYTIGSPLRKCRTLWPWLTAATVTGHRISWHNFSNVLDPVSNKKLGLNLGGEVDNHRLYAGGAARSHVIYEWNRRFLRIFAEHTLGPGFTRHLSAQKKPARTVIKGILRSAAGLVRSVVETAGLAAALFAGFALGIATTVLAVLFNLFTYWLIARLVAIAGWPGLGAWIQSALVWLVVITSSLVMLRIAITPRSLAARSAAALRNPPANLFRWDWQRPVTEEWGKVTEIGITTTPLCGERAAVRSHETNLGRLVADSTLWAARKHHPSSEVDIALRNGGCIRESISGPKISRPDINAALPFDGRLAIKELTGRMLLAAMEHAVSGIPECEGRFPQVAGMQLEYDANLPCMQGRASTDIASRIRKLAVTRFDGAAVNLITDGVANLEALDNTFKVATTHFIAKGGDGYAAFAAAEWWGGGQGEQKLLEDYIIDCLGGRVDLPDPPAAPRIIRLDVG